MPRITFRQQAIDDIASIWSYTVATWSEKQADKYHNSISSACKVIAQNPEAGRDYREIHEGLRGFRINKHIIFYHMISINEVEILRVLHAQMDFENRIEP